ncbi:MAG: hypothetical protein K6F86_02495 [Lachnospiraceae bacterium]|nr:hypothetical protein [Lachnospiraceae bacterium]
MDLSVIELRLQQWKPIFEAQAKSGLGKNEWCKKNGICRWEFYRRQRELRQYLLRERFPEGESEAETTDLSAVPETFVELPMVSKVPAEIWDGSA